MFEGKGISKNQKQGAVGESFIEARLKNFAHIARPANLLDYAIDFFCSLYEDNKPSTITFGVQAKSCKSFGKQWKESIKRDIVEFWLKQIFPVYIVVFDDETKECYWLSVEDNREQWLKKLKLGKKTLTITVTKKNRFIEEDFINKIQTDNIQVKANHGIPVFITKGYVGTIPYMKLSDTARIYVNQNVRLGLDYLIYDRILDNDFEGAYSLNKILATFDHAHYDHFLLLARICKQLGKTSEAIENYDMAIKICKSDPNWNKRKSPDDAFIEDIIDSLETEKLQLGKLSNKGL